MSKRRDEAANIVGEEWADELEERYQKFVAEYKNQRFVAQYKDGEFVTKAQYLVDLAIGIFAGVLMGLILSLLIT